MRSQQVRVQSVDGDMMTIVTDDGQTLRVEHDGTAREGDARVLTVTRGTDILNAILTDTPDEQEKDHSTQ